MVDASDPPSIPGDPPPPPRSNVLVDRISDLPEPLLLHILSFLPTHRAAQTCCLSSRFRKLWSASPSLHFDRFVKMVDHALLGRDCSALVERVRFNSNYDSRCLLPYKSVSRWIRTIDLLGVRHLNLALEATTVGLVCLHVFSIKSLKSLHISTLHFDGHRALMPTNISCTHLKVSMFG
jgi:F-box domain